MSQRDEDDGRVWWCQPCRETGLAHCSTVDFDCMGPEGPMLRIPREDAQQRYDALRGTR